ncbi:MAG TPA: AlkA N-terminal domain-containing protein, partial [Acidimicrobiales bacterium]
MDGTTIGRGAAPAAALGGGAAAGPDSGWHEVRLVYRPPLALSALLEFLAARAVPGVEEVAGGAYRRVLRLAGGPAVVVVEAAGGDPPALSCRVRPADPADVPAAVAACRRLFDLDADPGAVAGALGGDPLLAPVVAANPGRRAPVHVDAHELAFRAVLGQQVTLAAARRLAGQLVALCGEPLTEPFGGLAACFPTAAAVAGAELERLGMPGARRATLRTLATALADGTIPLHPGADAVETEARLLELRGIGPWTAAYVRMRGLGDPDVFLPGDVGVRRALTALGLGDGAPAAVAERWRPWRSYAV